jgi:hypothetical protein
LASAPGGSDSIRSVSDVGEGLNMLKLDTLGIHDEQAAKLKPHAATAMTRLIIRSHHLGGTSRLIPQLHPQATCAGDTPTFPLIDSAENCP